jgi:hypothetical protein
MRACYLGSVLLGLASCSVGPRAEKFAPAHSPGGADVRLEFGKGKPLAVGELIAVQDTALLIREESVLELVPFASISRGAATASGSRASFARRPTPAVRERLRLLSRYPGGVTPELLRQLLAAYEQTELKVRSP